MSILRSAARELRADFLTTADWLGWRDVTTNAMAYQSNPSGIPITASTALTCTAVYAAWSFISDTIATLPCGVFQRYGDGSRYGRPTPAWMKDPIPSELDWIGLTSEVLVSLLSDGNAFIGIERAADGVTPSELWPINPKSVQVIRNPGTNAVEFHVANRVGQPPFTSNEVLHIKAMTLPGESRGVSPIEHAAAMMGNNIAAQQFAGSSFRNKAQPGTIISSPAKLSDDQAKAIADRFDASRQGSFNAFRTVVMGGGAELKSITLTPEQIQMIDVLKWGVVEVARLYRIAPHLLMDVERTTSWGTGVAEQNMNTVQYTLRPWIGRLERSLGRLVYDTYLDPSYYLRFDIRDMLRPDPDQYAAYMTAKIQCQAATPNEWRSDDDQSPLPDGDETLLSIQWQPLEPPEPVTPPTSNGNGNGAAGAALTAKLVAQAIGAKGKAK